MDDAANFAFRCASPFTGANLCFNNGTCTTVNSKERCACEEPFESDMLYFHFDNCVTVRGARVSWLSFFAPFTFIFLCILTVLLREGTRLKKREKSLAQWTILAWTATWCFVLSTYAQDGCYESCAFFTSLAFILDYVMLYQAVMAIMEPFYVGTLLQRRSARPKILFKLMTSVFCVGAGIAGIFMLVHTRDEDRTTYNLATLGQCIVLWLAGMFFCAAIVVFAQALELRIRQVMQTRDEVASVALAPRNNMQKAGSFIVSSHASNASNTSASHTLQLNPASPPSASSGIASLLPRLKALRFGSLAVGVPFLFLLIPFPVAFYFLGSIPYYFVISILHFVSNILVVSGIAGFLWKSNRRRSQQERAVGAGDAVAAARDPLANLNPVLIVGQPHHPHTADSQVVTVDDN